MSDLRGAGWPGGLGGVAALTGIVLVALVMGVSGPASARVGGCPNRFAPAHSVSLTKIRQAITCLVQHRRHHRGLHRLNANRDLRRAARRHTEVMVHKDCFRHKCRHEPGLRRRIRRTGYLKGAKHFAFAENLGFASTPKAMLDVWMATGFDRRNILSRKYDDFGVGVDWGSPTKSHRRDRHSATYTIVFAHRRP